MDPNIFVLFCVIALICMFFGFVMIGGFGLFELTIATAMAMAIAGGLFSAALAS